MNATSFVLLYGRDRRLLETREWILETIGYRSQIVSRPEDFQVRLRDPLLALVVICHSIPAGDAEAAIATAHRQRSDLKILVLVATPSERLRGTGERTLDTQEGPGLLIEAVQQLMADRSRAAAQRLPQSEPRVMRLPLIPGA